jgi:hypothetical protein
MIDTEFDDEWLNRAIAAREARRAVLKAPRRYYHAPLRFCATHSRAIAPKLWDVHHREHGARRKTRLAGAPTRENRWGRFGGRFTDFCSRLFWVEGRAMTEENTVGRVLTRLGYVLYWAGFGLALFFILAGLWIIVLPFAAFCAVIFWVLGRAAKYVLAGK